MDGEQRIALVEAVVDGWTRGDWRAGADVLTPDAVVSWQEPPADLVVCRGAAEVARRLRAFLEQWEDFHIEPLSIEEVGDDGVVVAARQVLIGRTSGAEVDRDTWIVWRFDEDGRVAQIRWNWVREDAFAQAGFGRG